VSVTKFLRDDVAIAFFMTAVLILPAYSAYIPFFPSWSFLVPIAFLAFFTLVEMGLVFDGSLSAESSAFLCLSVCLCCWLAFSSLWTISAAQYRTDLLLLFVLQIVIFTSHVLLREQTIENFFHYFCFAVAFFGVFVVLEFFIFQGFEVANSVLGETYLTVANLLGLATVGAGVKFLVKPRIHFGWGILTIVLLLELSLSLARGALLSALSIILITAFISAIANSFFRKDMKSVVHSMIRAVLVSGFVLGTIISALQVERTRQRLVAMLGGDASGRWRIWEDAWDSIQVQPWFGYGLGGNGFVSYGIDGSYPHNLFLQVWLDGGIIAVLLLSAIVLLPFGLVLGRVIFGWNGRSELVFIFLGMFTFEILEFSKSGNFYAARSVFICGSVVTILIGQARQKKVQLVKEITG
jgi:O-antigen ligase